MKKNYWHRVRGHYVRPVPLLALLLFLLLTGLVQAQTITGTVYRDFNSNGTYQSIPTSGTYTYGEPGVPGVIVTAYSSNSSASPISATTNANGSYTLTVGSGGQFRVEFSNFVSGDFDGFRGTASATSVQFVNGGTSSVNLGINYPAHYCGVANPYLVTSCYTNGDPVSSTSTSASNPANDPWMVGWQYNGASTDRNTYLAKGNIIGSTWGLAYQRSTNSLFAAAFMKRHAGFGKGGPGQIYKLDMSNPTSATASAPVLFVNLETDLGIPVGSDPRSGTATLPTSKTVPNHDAAAFDLVGKMSLGDIDISDDEKTLWVMNLFDRSLYELPIGSPATKPTSFIQHILPSNVCGTTGILRPFATKFYRGKVYVGAVCSAENSGGTAANLNAYVYVHDPAGATSNFTQVLTFPLNYSRGYAASRGTGTGTGPAVLAGEWRPWIDQWTDIPSSLLLGAYNQTSCPQPVLSDIEFDINGEMIVGFFDRFSHQSGNNNYSSIPTSTSVYEGAAAGDMLRAGRKADGTYQIENNTLVTNYPANGAPAVSVTTIAFNQNLPQGPGKGEYYWQDMYGIDTTPASQTSDGGHQEVLVGGLSLYPGTGQVVSTAFDPASNYRAAGARYFDNKTGYTTYQYQVLTQDGGLPETQRVATFGKAASLGDLELFCDPAPIQIGNRVWNDQDNDGVQDPNEPALPGVVVTLKGPGYTGGISVTTNSSGEYYFSNATGTNTTGYVYNLTALTAGGSYSLTFPTAFSTLTLSSNPNSATGTNADKIDSDPNASGVIAFTLGNAGENNFSYDAAYTTQPPCSLSLTVTAGTCQSATNTYTLSGTIAITNSVAQTLVITDDCPSANPKSLTLTATASTTALPFSLTGLESGSGRHTVTITSSATTCGTASKTYVAPGGCLLACPGNLLANPSFEQGLPTSPTAITTVSPPPSWTGGIAESNPDANFNPKDGIAFGYTGASSASLCQSVPATIGSIYTLTFYAGVHQANGQTVQLQYLNGTSVLGTPKAFTITHILESDGDFGGPYTLLSDAAPANATHLRVCAVGTTADANHWAKVDAMCLTEQKGCLLSLSVTPGSCNAVTNQYAVSGTLSLSNTPAGSFTISDGTKSTVVSVTAGQTSAAFSLTGLTSNGIQHTVTVLSSATACGTVSKTYTAPVSCSCASIGAVTPITVCQGQAIAPVCVTTNVNQTIELLLFPQAVANPYTASGAIRIAEATATNGTACITISTTAVPNNSGTTSATYVMYACLKPTPTDPNCQTISLSSAIFTVLPKPALSLAATPGLTVTQGSTVTLTASGCAGGSLTWSNNVTGSGTMVTGIAGSASNTYSATCTTGPGCLTTASITIATVPPASIQVGSATVCAGSPASLTAMGCTGTVSWTGANITSGANSSMVTVSTSSTISSQQVISYTATCSGQTSTTYAIGTVTVVPQPSVTLTASSATAVVGQSVTLLASGCTGSLSGAISGTATMAVVQPTAGSNVYSVTCTVQPGCSKSASVTVTGIAPTTLTVMNTTVCAGSPASLTAMGCTGTVSWTGANITSGATSSIVTVSTSSTITTQQVVSYTVTCSAAGSNPVVGTVTIVPQPTLSLTAIRSSNGTSVTLVTTGCVGGSLLWSTNATTSSIVVTPSATTLYSVTCTVPPGCSRTARLRVGAVPTNLDVVTSGAIVCAGQSVTLTASNCAADIQWNTGATTTSVVVNPVITTGYSVTCSDEVNTATASTTVTVYPAPALNLAASSQTITAGTSATLTASGCQSGTVVWSTGANAVMSIVVSPTATSTYSATCTTGPQCSTSTSIMISIAQLPTFSLTKLVSTSKAQIGQIITYTVVLTNTGSGAATNVVVRDSISLGLAYVPGSATTSVGSYSVGNPVSLWSIASLPANATATLTFSASATAEGVVYNRASIPGDTATVCTSVPIKVCKGSSFAIELSAPAGYSRYQWFRRSGTSQEVLVYDGAVSSFTATAVGEYRVVVNDLQGSCPNLSCCPAIIEEDSIPAFTVMAKTPSCIANQPLPDGTLTVMGLGQNPDQYTYAISEGSSFTVANPTAVPVPTNGVIASTLNATKSYTVRVYNALGCYRDVTVTITVNCACPPEICVPVSIKKTRTRVVR